MPGSPTNHFTLLPAATLAGAGTYTSTPIICGSAFSQLSIQTKFVRAGGGTSCDVYIQTTLDNGTTWIDIAHHSFLTTTATKVSEIGVGGGLPATYTPTDATLAADSVVNGVMGNQLRVKYVVVGTYSGASSLTVDCEARTGVGGSGQSIPLAATATVTSVNDQATSTTLLSANGGRKGAVIFNDSTSILYVKFGETASATDFTMKLGPGESGYLTQPVYTGRIDGLWSADASGAARVTELT